jgi:phosphate transport system permease protein
VCISLGGVGTIAAVALIFVFLVWVVVPLFGGADQDLRSRATVEHVARERLFALCVDEYRDVGLGLARDGRLSCWRASDGRVFDELPLLADARLTSVSTRDPNGDMAFGFEDGSVRLGRIAFHSAFHDPEHEPTLVRDLAGAETGVSGSKFVRRLASGQLRVTAPDVKLEAALALGLTAPITALDMSIHGSERTLVALDEHGRAIAARVEQTENFLTGEVATDVHTHEIVLRPTAHGSPTRLLLTGRGDVLFAVWDDGILQRYDLRDLDHPALCEELDLVDGPGELTAITFLIGKTTLITGDSHGRIRGWFGTKPENALTPDGIRLERTHDLNAGGAAVTALAASARGRIVCAGFADGTVKTFHVTSHKLLLETSIGQETPITSLAVAPKEDGFVAVAGPAFFDWNMNVGYPEATLAALFRPVWYEGYPAPAHVWQSTSGTDDFEPKLGLWPLVFGTLKSTFYSMIFGAPIALLAAIFTSEFLHKRLKGPLKSITEMMASLPSVVLGFIAAIVIAPIVQRFVPTVLALFFTIPFALLLGAYLWQMLPPRLLIGWSGLPRFVAMSLCLPLGVMLAVLIGPLAERIWFGGDILSWLSGSRGDAVGGWLLLLMPLSVLVYVVVSSRFTAPWFGRLSANWDRARSARFDFVKFLVAIVFVFVIALVGAHVCDGVGLDPRGGPFDTYIQRNALIVGFVMGFATIPIIYTLAEDALSSVPAHLRLASLGAGATGWQTAMRVVVPTAMSGLFSAVMIGLGRAVGETMIVLMATGNTPVMSWNVFNGFRTLSANIAVELPEAVRDSTHYRTLFLAAFCLFALTFVLNTFAEVVRQRFRKRAYQL